MCTRNTAGVLLLLTLVAMILHVTPAGGQESSGFGTFRGEPVDRGFVFWEGRYLDAPYSVDRVELAVHINGIQVTQPLPWPPEVRYRFDHDPGFPAGLTRQSTLEEALRIREPGGLLFDTAKQWYLFTHHPYDEAYERVTDYYRNLPCVRDMYRDENGIWVLESFQGEIRRIQFGGSRMRMVSEMYGPDGTGSPSRDEYVERVEALRQRYERRLEKGDCFFLFSGADEIAISEERAAVLLPEALSVLRSSSLSAAAKQEELVSLGVLPRETSGLCERFVAGFETSSQLDVRLESLRSAVLLESGPDALPLPPRNVDLDARERKDLRLRSGEERGERLKNDGAYSPDGTFLYAWCGYTYDPAFSGFPAEIAAVGDYVRDQDYNVSLCIYTDDDDEDGDCEECTYGNLQNMRFADVLYYACHGEPSGGGNYLEMVVLESQAQILAWCGNDPLVVPVELTGENWPTGHPWVATGTTAWATAHWNAMLTQSRAITILSCCYGFENGWAAACGGGVAFGYNTWTTGIACETNNEELLRRMNGSLGDGDHRMAGEAYDDMPAHLRDFRIVPAGAKVTLCPATEDKFPEGAADESGTGHFMVDTYCQDNIPAGEALEFAISRGVQISNVRWEGSGKVRKVLFDWTGTGDWEVTVTALAEKFRSWGAAVAGSHRMDGNRVTPNGDNVTWTFFHESPGPDIILVLDSSGSMANENKLSWAKAAARYFVDNTRALDWLGIVSFSSFSRLVAPLTFIPDSSPYDPVKQLLKSALYTITAGGNTNFGAGLQTAYDQLAASGTPQKFVVFMSDGYHNTGTYAAQVAAFQAMGWPIFTVGFGAEADVATLMQIALQTGGMYFPATTTDIQAIYDLIQIIIGGSTGLRVSHGWINPGQTVVEEVVVPAGAAGAQFSLFWPTQALDLTLTAPDGSAITPGVAMHVSEIAYVETPSYAYYEVDSPLPGVWRAHVTGVEVPDGGAEYGLNVAADAAVSCNFLAFDALYEPGDPVLARVSLRKRTGDSWGAVVGAEVSGRLIRPDGGVASLVLNDAGVEGDAVASDGIYSALFQNTDVTGSYALTVTASGTVLPEDFEPELRKTIQVGDYARVGLAAAGFRPEPETSVETSPSGIAARVVGCGAEIDPASIVLTVDGIGVPHSYDPSGQIVVWEPLEPLAEGEHAVILDLSDVHGVPVPQAAWSFTVGSYAAVEATDLAEMSEPVAFGLYSVAPNPFGRATEIGFGLPEHGRVNLTVHDVRGRLVRELVSGLRSADRHSVSWDGRDDSGRIVPPGIYFVRLEAGGDRATGKILVVR